MKKKIVVITLVAILFLGLVAVTIVINNKPFLYENQRLGYCIELPHSWKGKFVAFQVNNKEVFYQQKTYEKYGGVTGELFSIIRLEGNLDKEETENTYNLSHFLINNNGYAYIMSMQYDGESEILNTENNEKIVNEYKNMYDDAQMIRQSFKTIDSNKYGNTAIITKDCSLFSDFNKKIRLLV